MSQILNSDQEHALGDLKQFSLSVGYQAHILIGVAGTGKTTLTKEFAKMVRKRGLQILAVASTHKARKVLHKILNTNFMLKIPAITVASLLGKGRKHGYIGTHNYCIEQDHKMALYDIIIVDEVSMLDENDYELIINLAKELEKKVLFIGDEAQIPNPSQKLVLRQLNNVSYYEKATVVAFTTLPASHLHQVMRQHHGSDLLDLCQRLHNCIGIDMNLSELISGQSYKVHDPCSFIQTIKALGSLTGKDLVNRRIITYTNASVNGYNKIVREARGYKEILHVDDLLTGYNNVGQKNDLLIENGQDYLVLKKSFIDTKVGEGIATSGFKVTVCEIDPSQVVGNQKILYFPDLYDERNNALLEEIVRLATKVNSRGSTKLDYKNYLCLKNQIIFQENIYQYRNSHGDTRILTGMEMQTEHALLFIHTIDVIDPKTLQILDNVDSRNLREKYPGLLETRTQDTKSLSSSETLADQFQVLEKDIDYGYAITTHKSQGSTYDITYVDLWNLRKLRDGFYRGLPVYRARERDQLRYVAISRARTFSHIGVRDSPC